MEILKKMGMSMAMIVLLASIMAYSTVYEIGNRKCALLYDSETEAFSGVEKCNDGDPFYMKCHFSHYNRHGASYVHFYFDDFKDQFKRPAEINTDGKGPYGYKDFSIDLSVDNFGFCQVILDLRIKKH